jgi:quercetin dioxygenase-like cupin family protein
MALEHAQPGQVIDVSPLGAALPASATHAILKTHALELMRIVLREGKSMPPHSVYGEVTILCLEGSLSVEFDGNVCTLQRHQLVLLPAGITHSVNAITDTSALVTVQTPAGLPGSGSSTR